MSDIWIGLGGALITALGTFAGVYYANSKAQAVTDVKIEELTREVRSIENFAQRIPVIEEKVKRAEARIGELEQEVRS